MIYVDITMEQPFVNSREDMKEQMQCYLTAVCCKDMKKPMHCYSTAVCCEDVKELMQCYSTAVCCAHVLEAVSVVFCYSYCVVCVVVTLQTSL